MPEVEPFDLPGDGGEGEAGDPAAQAECPAANLQNTICSFLIRFSIMKKSYKKKYVCTTSLSMNPGLSNIISNTVLSTLAITCYKVIITLHVTFCCIHSTCTYKKGDPK